MSKIIEGLKYSESHEWVKVEGNIAAIGVTDFAQKEMGDITYVDMPDVDDEVSAGEEFGALESVKAASDLISPVSGTVTEVNGDSFKTYEISPEEFGLKRYDKSEIVGGTPAENAQITRGILDGSVTGAKRDIVLMNAGAALYTYGVADTLKDGIAKAAEVIDNGSALAKLDEFVKFTNEME